MSIKPYPKYKDSGVEWLGMVPEGWEVKPLKAVASHNDETIDESHDADYEILYVDISGVDASKGIQIKEALRFGEAPSRARRIVKNGDVIVSTVRTYLRAIAPVKDPEPNLVVSTGFAVIRANDRLDPHFSPYVLSAAHFIEQVIARSVGISYPAINASDLVRIPVPLPTLAEQSAIASFLDHETSKIDALISEQEKLIELLKEKRSAVISHAVTKGLNHNVKMKDSGVEWLGMVPECWEVKRLRFAAKLNPSKSELSALDRSTLVSFLPMECIGEDGTLQLEKEKPIGELETGYTYFRDGDVTIAKITPCYENGKGAIMRGLLNGVGFGTTELIVIRPLDQAATPSYLQYLFTSSSFRKIGESHMYGAGGQKRVPDSFVRDFSPAFPPYSEQIQIASFLDHETAKIDALTTEAKHGIDLLQERRSALISAAVTGQIDVRAA